MKICKENECKNQVKARELCSTCYRRSVVRGDFIPNTATEKWKHRLSNIDEINKTATCLVCGYVKILKRENNTWRCSIPANERSKLAKRKARAYKKEMLIDHCEICGTNQKLCWDHCHKSNKFRGTLCSNCNMGIGLFKDDPKILKNAAKYIERYNNANKSCPL